MCRHKARYGVAEAVVSAASPESVSVGAVPAGISPPEDFLEAPEVDAMEDLIAPDDFLYDVIAPDDLLDAPVQ